MDTLREKMALHGFESNEDYDLVVRCLLESSNETLRCLNVTGAATRRKTAFANALAQSLEYKRVLYHDFTQNNPPQPEVIIPRMRDEMGREETPIDPFDQILSEACAYSEGEPTVLIVDQLHAADFREHIRIYDFLRTHRWNFRDAEYTANPNHLLVILISDAPLYHSLHKLSFRVWVEAGEGQSIDYQPQDFGLDMDALGLMQALNALFYKLGDTPTRSEYKRIIHDLQHLVRTPRALRESIFGWTETVDRSALFATELDPELAQVIAELQDYLGIDEVEIQTPVSSEE